MKSAVGYGIDFGTSNSSIAIAYDDRTVDVVRIARGGDMPHSLPSIAYLHRSGNRDAGEDAVNEYLITGAHRTRCGVCPLVILDVDGQHYSDCNQYQRSGQCNDSRLITALKSEMTNSAFESTHSWGVDLTMPSLVAIILSNLKARADRTVGHSVSNAVMGHPVAFAGAEGDDFDERQDLAEARLVGAAHAAGLREVELLFEPAAAVLDEPLSPGFSVSADFGGGTYDVAVIEMPEDGVNATVAGLQGAAVGGQDFDALIFDYAVADQIGVNQVVMGRGGKRSHLPRWVASRMRTLAGVRHLLSDQNLSTALNSLDQAGGDITAIDEILHGGQAYAFYQAIEHAKIEISEKDEARIRFARHGISVDAKITRAEFEDMISSHLGAVERATLNAIEEAEIRPEEVHTVLRTGGSSQIPAFVRLLERTFPNAIMREQPVFTSVARGLGIDAARRWGDG